MFISYHFHRVLTIMFISHLLATRKVQADQGTQANEGREIENKKKVFCHIATLPKKNLLKCLCLTGNNRKLSQKKLTTKPLVTIKLLVQMKKVSF